MYSYCSYNVISPFTIIRMSGMHIFMIGKMKKKTKKNTRRRICHLGIYFPREIRPRQGEKNLRNMHEELTKVKGREREKKKITTKGKYGKGPLIPVKTIVEWDGELKETMKTKNM